uniref:Carbonic anhydrase n=1 Tax=Tetraselmis sp. GSL018 TaxID=582737 RepID=A0A061R0L7_9CHLO
MRSFIYAVVILSAANCARGAGYNYFSLAEDWKKIPDSWCASTEQTPIDVEAPSELGQYEAMPTRFNPTFSLPTVEGVTANNNGHNVNLQFGASPGAVFRYPKDGTFTSLYGKYTGTGKLPGRKLSQNDDYPQHVAAVQGTLIDLHWHVPSEHSVNGRLYDAEGHFVHTVSRPDDPDCTYMAGEAGPFCLAVVGVLYELHHDATEAELDEGFTQLLENFEQLPSNGEGDTAELPRPLDFEHFLPSSKEFWSYRGSLTTPTCNENVTWYLLQQPKAIGWSHFAKLQNAILHEELGDLNARPPLPLNSRVVFKSNFGDKAVSSVRAAPQSYADHDHEHEGMEDHTHDKELEQAHEADKEEEREDHADEKLGGGESVIRVENGSGEGMSTAAVLAIVFGVLLVVIVAATCTAIGVWCFCMKRPLEEGKATHV